MPHQSKNYRCLSMHLVSEMICYSSSVFKFYLIQNDIKLDPINHLLQNRKYFQNWYGNCDINELVPWGIFVHHIRKWQTRSSLFIVDGLSAILLVATASCMFHTRWWPIKWVTRVMIGTWSISGYWWFLGVENGIHPRVRRLRWGNMRALKWTDLHTRWGLYVQNWVLPWKYVGCIIMFPCFILFLKNRAFAMSNLEIYI